MARIRIFRCCSFVGFVFFIAICLVLNRLSVRKDIWPSAEITVRGIFNPMGRLPQSDTVGSEQFEFKTSKNSLTSLYVYSALFEDDTLRIVVLKSRSLVVKGIYCLFWYPPDDVKSTWRTQTVEASVRDLNEHHGLKYTSAFIMCPLQERFLTFRDTKSGVIQRDLVIPSVVRLVRYQENNHREPMVELPVAFPGPLPNNKPPQRQVGYTGSDPGRVLEKNTDILSLTRGIKNKISRRVEFTICVPVLQGKFGDVVQLVEKIEMSRLLGAGRIVFYNQSITSNVDAVLRMYIKAWEDGKDSLEVAVLPWPVQSFFSGNTLYEYGKVAALNDCLHRYKPKTTFTVFTGLDQHIFPRKRSTWLNFLQDIQESDISVYLFRKTIFRTEWPSPVLGLEAATTRHGSQILGFTKREKCTSPTSVRAGVIVNPRKIEEIGEDYVRRMEGKVYSVLENEGLVNQYGAASREEAFEDDETKKCSSSVIDAHAGNMFHTNLTAALDTAWSKLPDLKWHQQDNEPRGEVKRRTEHQATSLPLQHPYFRLVEGLGSPLFVYSALWLGNKVRLVVIKVQDAVMSDIYCVFMQGSTRFVEKAVVKNFYQFVAEYTSAYVTCSIGKGRFKDNLPLLVGLVTGKDRSSTPKVTFPVEGREDQLNKNKDLTPSSKGGTVELTVCTPAMHGFSNAAQLVEKIEMSRLLGAGRIVFYNHSITSNVDAVLRLYVREWAEGNYPLEVVVFPWVLPSLSGKVVKIPYFAQLASIDDCLYRYRRTTRYTEFSDLDEFLVPLRHDNRSQLLAVIDKKRPNIAGFMFRCTVVNKDLPEPAKGFQDVALKYGSSILGHTRRDNLVFKPGKRSKLIVKPQLVEEMGVHFIQNASGRTEYVPVEDGLLYHYRNPLDICSNLTQDTRVAHKFGQKLAARLKVVWDKLPDAGLGWKPTRRRDFKQCNKKCGKIC